MIRLFPGINPLLSQTSTGGVGISFSGALFSAGSFELELSLPANFVLLGYPEQDTYLAEDLKKNVFKIFDVHTSKYIADENDPLKIWQVAFPKQRYFVDGDRSAGRTTVHDVKFGKKIEFPSFIGKEVIDIGGTLLLREARTATLSAVNLDEGVILWQRTQKGTPCVFHDNSYLFFESTEKSSFFTWISADSGESLRAHNLDFVGSVSGVLNQQLLLVGFAPSSCNKQIILYHYATDKFRVIPIDDKLAKPHRINNHFLQCTIENQFDVWNGSSTGKCIVKSYEANLGTYVGRVLLPNMMFSNYPNFFESSLHFGVVGQSRAPWPANYWQLAIWDKQDFESSDHEVLEEPLIAKSERILDKDQSFFRIFIDHQSTNYFQLHRQLSVKLHQTGAINGYHMSRDDKGRDPDFNGKLICDVSNHDLNEKEKLAIRHMCEHVAFELTDGGFRSSYDPAVKIHIEPVFKDA